MPYPHVPLTLSFFFYLEAYKKNAVVLVLHIKNVITHLNLKVQTHLHYRMIDTVSQKPSLIIFPTCLITTLKMEAV